MASAAAGSCQTIEYAELKDTPTERLTALYCKYEATAKIQQEARRKLTAIGATVSARSYGEDEAGCYEEISKIGRALKNRSAPMPTCRPE